jgi:Nuclear transport factor 2 (NTF2) domain
MTSQGVLVLTNKEIVNEYFRLISKRDVKGLVNLFSEDCTIYEPFSKENGLHGKYTIEHFFKVAVMANAGISRTIRFVENNKDSITALICFKRQSVLTGRFQFYFVTTESSKKIKTLRIEFI